MLETKIMAPEWLTASMNLIFKNWIRNITQKLLIVA